MATPTSGTPIIRTALTGNAAVDSLLDGFHWAKPALTYSFVAPGASVVPAQYPEPSFWTAVRALDAAQQAAATGALAGWANVANLAFTQVADNATSAGTIRIGFSLAYDWDDSAAATYLPNAASSGGDVWLDPATNDAIRGNVSGTFGTSAFGAGSYAYYTLLHELGHALGMKHPFEASGNGGGAALTGTQYAALDSREQTLMSYTTQSDHADARYFTYNPTTPMVLDIAAAQAVYGANSAYNAGDTTYAFNDNPGQYYFQTIWDGGGANAIAYTGNTDSMIDLRAGHGSRIGNAVYAGTATVRNAYVVENLWIAYDVRITTATVSGQANCTLVANDFGCVLQADAGYDTLIGGAGADLFTGGRGNDVLTGGDGADTAIYTGLRENYTLTATIGGYTIRDNRGIEGSDTLSGIEYLRFADGLVTIGAATNKAPAVPTLSVARDAAGVIGGNMPILAGKAEAGAKVGLYDGQTLVATVTANADGAWYYISTLPMKNGDYQFTANARDAAGNTSARSAPLAFKVATALNVTGGAASEQFQGMASNNVIDGAGGIDTVVYDAVGSASVTIVRSGAGLVLTDSTGQYGTDVLLNVERVQFADGVRAFDTGGTAGQAYRLYKAAFDRAPDLAGLGFWVKALDNGVTLDSVAKDFIGSAEFHTMYGDGLDSRAFLTELYDNVLHRLPDASGLAFWQHALDTGVSRAHVLAQFSESPENQAQLIGTMQNGFDYLPFG